MNKKVNKVKIKLVKSRFGRIKKHAASLSGLGLRKINQEVLIDATPENMGMGFLFIQAVQFVDIPIMSAYLVFIAFVFVMINFIVDILYYFIDPRIRVKSEAVSG